MNKKIFLILANLIVFNIGILLLMSRQVDIVKPQPQFVPEDGTPIVELQAEPEIINYQINTPIPEYLNYDQTVSQLKKWNEEAPKLTEIATYGKSSKGKDLYYLKISSPKNGDKKTVMITACIHGNEPLSASTVMGYIGTLLDQYGDNQQITNLIDSRDIYFVPIVSPDSYPQSRHVDGVDPNRDFPTTRDPDKISVPPVQAIKELFSKIQPDAVISGHTWGRVFLTPYGDRVLVCPNNEEYKRIIGKMGEMSNYRVIRACELYGKPIYGTDVDWYYRNGAFAIVMEFGTHQRVPTMTEIKTEFNRTFEAILYFIEEGPKVEIKFFAENEWRIAA